MAEFRILTLSERIALYQNGIRNAETQIVQLEINIAVNNRLLQERQAGQQASAYRTDIDTWKRQLGQLALSVAIMAERIAELERERDAADGAQEE